MKEFELVLSKPNAPAIIDHKENEMQPATLSLFFDLHPSPVAEKYYSCLREVVAKGEEIAFPDRTYNFLNDPRDAAWIAAELNKQIDIINAYKPNVIPMRAQSDMGQSLMNDLHVFFEKLRGGILRPSLFYLRAPKGVRRALESYNLLIHRYEDHIKSKHHSSTGKPPYTKVIVEFANRSRYKLADEDYKYFTTQVQFGTWNINYCEVGKSLLDVYFDNDSVVGDQNIRPLKYLSADGMIEFSQSMSIADNESMLSDFYHWWDLKADHLLDLGFKKFNPKNSIGWIPVATLNRQDARIHGLSDDEVRQLMSPYIKILEVRVDSEAHHRPHLKPDSKSNLEI